MQSYLRNQKANRNRKQMLRIEVNKGGIERALKNYKSKVIRTKQLKEVRDRKQFTKPSEIKRKQKEKAKYVQSKKDSNE